MCNRKKMHDAWEKLAAVGLSLSLLLTAGCGSGAPTTGASTGEAVITEENTGETQVADEHDPFGAYKETVVLKIGMAVDPNQTYPEGQSPTDNQYTRYIKEKLNIDVQVVWTASNSDYDQKVNLAIASDDLPDALVVNDTQYRAMLEADQLEPLTEAYENYVSPVLKSMIDSSNGLAMNNMCRDGVQYSMATVSGGDMHTVWVRKDWMDKLGLEEPKTMEDIENIAKVFMENKMGGENTIGIAGPSSGQALYSTFLSSGTNNFGLAPVFNAFKSYPGWWVEDENGKAVYGSTTRETKEALRYLAHLYAEGILDPEMSIRSDASETVVSGQCGILFGGWWLGYAFMPDLLDNDPTANFRAYLAPENEDGVYAYEASSASTAYAVVRKGYEHPEALIKIHNLLMRDESTFDTDALAVGNYPLRIAFGMRNEKETMITCLRQVLSGEAQPNDFSGEEYKVYKTLKNDASKIKQIKLAPYDDLDIQYWNRDADPATFNRVWSWMVGYSPFLDYPHTPVYSLTYSQTATMEERWSILQKLEDETFLKIIMGAADIDTFDQFVEDWYAQGGETITQEVRESLQ